MRNNRATRPQTIGRRSNTFCSPDTIILKSDLDERTRYRNGDTGDIIETIRAMDADSDRWINPDAVDCLRGSDTTDTLRNVWAFVKRHNRYRADRPGHEKVKSPGALFTTGVGDCKSFSIATGALLRALGIPYKYRFTAYSAGGDFSHVYVVADTPDGWVPIDAVHKKPLEEVHYTRRRDMAPAKAIAAVPGNGWWPRQTEKPAPTEPKTIDWKKIGLLALLFYLIAR